jgi:hypothetical protein
MINHQPPTGPNLTSERCNSLFGGWCVLQDSKAHHRIKVSWKERKCEYIRLRNQMTIVNREIPCVGNYRFT